jgi:CHAD domain-containing protein
MPERAQPKVALGLCPGLPQDVAVQVVLRGHIARFGRELARLTQHDPPPDATHLTRVALRRLRGALQAASPRIDRHLNAQICRRLRVLFRALGVVRDAEVLAEHGGSDAGRQPLAARERKALRKGLKASDAAHLAKDMDALFAGKSWRKASKAARARRKDPIETLASLALNRAWARATNLGASVTALAPLPRHALRKRLKSLRYIAEDFAPLWPAEASIAFLAALSDLQDDLGLLNDMDLAAAQGLPRDGDLAKTALARAEGRWHWLCAQPPWWAPPTALQPPSLA